MTRSRLYSGEVRMSNRQYHRQGQPRWWARIGSGADVQWVQIPRTRSDYELDAVVDLPPGTTVHIGAGNRQRGIRATVKTLPLDD